MMKSSGFDYLATKKLVWDAYYISFLSERYGGKSMPLLRGAWVGLRSNLKARRSGMYSSLVYLFEKPE